MCDTVAFKDKRIFIFTFEIGHFFIDTNPKNFNSCDGLNEKCLPEAPVFEHLVPVGSTLSGDVATLLMKIGHLDRVLRV